MGRPKRREPEVGGSGPAASAAQHVGERDRRRGDLCRFVRRMFAAKWSPRLGLDLAGGVSVVYTAQGKHVSQADLDETVNILNLHVNGLGVSGTQVQTSGPNQIFGLHSRRHRCAAGARPDRSDGTHVLPPGRVLGLPAGHAEELEG